MRCEDYPCCGHMDEDGQSWCPTEDGRFPCCICGDLMEKGARSSICGECQRNPATFCEGQDCPGCSACWGDDEDSRFCPECGAQIDPDDFGCVDCEIDVPEE